jgi:cobalt-zinc-cadmium efflux system membrane fusion protein
VKRLIALGFALAFGTCSKPPVKTESTATSEGEAWLSPDQVLSSKLVIAPASEHAVSAEVSASGELTFYDLRVSHVFSPVTGRVTKILAEPGSRVAKGASLAEIESPDVGDAFSDLAKGQADLVAAQSELRRQTELFDAHAGAQRDLETARSNFAKASAEHQRAAEKARLFRAGAGGGETARYVLRSPIGGEVIARNVNPGSEVQGQYAGGTAIELFTIGDLDPIVMMADVYEMDLARVKKGAHTAITIAAYPGRTFEGKIDTIYDQLDPVTRTAKVRCLIANPAGELKPHMFASVSISTSEQRVLSIPRTAMLRLGDNTVVFVRKQLNARGAMLFERRPLAVDEDEGGEYVPVIRGLSAGEEVVTSGAILLAGFVQ